MQIVLEVRFFIRKLGLDEFRRAELLKPHQYLYKNGQEPLENTFAYLTMMPSTLLHWSIRALTRYQHLDTGLHNHQNHDFKLET